MFVRKINIDNYHNYWFIDFYIVKTNRFQFDYKDFQQNILIIKIFVIKIEYRTAAYLLSIFQCMEGFNRSQVHMKNYLQTQLD